ncbi:MAG: OsmC family protein [Gemmatimonadota bacterium]
MDAATLKARQTPLKEKYRTDPSSALVVSRAEGRLTEGITCTVTSWNGETVAGLHSAAGGDGSRACSADMLLQALVACAGVTLNSVATHMGVRLDDAVIEAEGKWDARGTLGVSRDVPVGLTEISLSFRLEPEPEPKTRDKLIELAERYCVIFHTLKNGTEIEVRPPAPDVQPSATTA